MFAPRCHFRYVSICAVLTFLLIATRSPAEKPAPKDAKTAEEAVRSLGQALEIVLSPFQRVRESMARAQASNNLRQLALAIQNYQPGVPVQPPIPNEWIQNLLPYIEQNQTFPTGPYKMFLCPTSPGSDRFGAGIEPVSPVLASQLGLPKDFGQVVGAVSKSQSAEKAGLREHDILLKLNGKDVPRDAEAFAKLLAEIKPDQAVDALVLRAGKRNEIKGLALPAAVLTPNPLLPKLIPDGTSNTILFAEGLGAAGAWGGLAASDGWKVWSKGDPILATTFRTKERFTTRQQEGTLVLTVVGTVKDGKAAAAGITVREGSSEKKYAALEKVPAEYRDKVAQLLEMSAK